jgi:hypothetical protein
MGESPTEVGVAATSKSSPHRLLPVTSGLKLRPWNDRDWVVVTTEFHSAAGRQDVAMTDRFKAQVTFEFDGSAEQVHLCLQPCDGGVTAARAGRSCRWQTAAMREVSPGAWTLPLQISPGWWRVRYYTEERGCLFYAEPNESYLRMDGLDAILHVSRTPDGGVSCRAGGVASPVDQYLCVLPEDHHADAPQVGAAEAAAVSPSASAKGAKHRDEPSASDARRPDRRRQGAARDRIDEATY